MLLVYFPDEESVSVVKESSLIINIKELKQGSLCCVKKGGKVYNDDVVEVGKSSSVAMFCFIIIVYNIIYIKYIHVLKSPGSLEFLKAAEEKFLMGEVSYDSLN